MTAISQALAIGLNLITFPILSRLLGPDDIGLVAMGGIVTGLAAAFVDSGLSAAAIQAPKLSRQQASNLFWCNFGLGVVLAAACLLISPIIAWVFQDARLTAIVAVSSLSILLVGASLQHAALLRRRMRFTAVAVISIAAGVAGQAVAVGIAYAYESYWALVARLLAQSGVTLVGTWAWCHWMPNLPRRGAGTRPFAVFGSKVFGSRLVFQASVYADTALLGLVSTAAAVGLYDRAFQLMLAPIRKINGPLGGVMLPTLSRCSDDPARYRVAFLSVLTLLVLVMAPIAGLVIGAPDWVVMLAMGDGWDEAVPLFRIVGIGLVLSPLYSATAWLFTSQGRVGEQLKWQTIDAAARLLLLSIGAIWGVTGIVGAVVARLLTMPHAFYYVLGRGGPVGLRDYLPIEAAAVSAAGAGALGAYAVRAYAMPDSSVLTGTPVAAAASAAASCAVLAVLPGFRGRIMRAWSLLRQRAD